MTENFIGANTVRKLIEEKINLILVFHLKVTTGVKSGPGLVSSVGILFFIEFIS